MLSRSEERRVGKECRSWSALAERNGAGKFTLVRVPGELVRDDGIVLLVFFSGRRRHTSCGRDWSSDVCSSDLCLIVLTLRDFEVSNNIFINVTGDYRVDVRRLTDAASNATLFSRLNAVQIGRASCRERV